MNPKLSGRLLILTGVIHTIVGLLIGYPYLLEMWQAGLWNSVDPHMSRVAIFWFLLFGFLLMMVGQVISTTTRPVPKVFGWSLLAMSALGALMMPISGFWLVIPQALYLLWKPKPVGLTSAEAK
jgi:uncharacterized protein with PQ loop repeat